MNAFVHHKRGGMSKERRARIFYAHDGFCHKCKFAIARGADWDVDHILALENGGTDDDSNLAPCCESCHVEKTGDDHSLAGHGRRMAIKHVVPKRFLTGKGWRK